MAYAEGTSVSPERSRAEIERILARYGADAFSYGWEGERAIVAFRAHGRMIRFNIQLPDREQFRRTPSGRRTRSDSQVHVEWEKAQRQRWRALALVVKAKLEAVESGITTFEEEFLAHILLPNGTTVGETVRPDIELAYETGKMPKLLGAGA